MPPPLPRLRPTPAPPPMASPLTGPPGVGMLPGERGTDEEECRWDWRKSQGTACLMQFLHEGLCSSHCGGSCLLVLSQCLGSFLV